MDVDVGSWTSDTHDFSITLMISDSWRLLVAFVCTNCISCLLPLNVFHSDFSVIHANSKKGGGGGKGINKRTEAKGHTSFVR